MMAMSHALSHLFHRRLSGGWLSWVDSTTERAAAIAFLLQGVGAFRKRKLMSCVRLWRQEAEAAQAEDDLSSESESTSVATADRLPPSPRTSLQTTQQRDIVANVISTPESSKETKMQWGLFDRTHEPLAVNITLTVKNTPQSASAPSVADVVGAPAAEDLPSPPKGWRTPPLHPNPPTPQSSGQGYGV